MRRDFFSDDQNLGKVYDSRLVARLLPFIKPYALPAGVAVILVILGMSLFLVNPYILGKVVDLGIKPRDPGMITKLAVLYALIELFVFLLTAAQNYLLRYVGQKVMYDIRALVFSHLQRMSISFFDRNPVGRLVTRTSNDVASLGDLFSSGLVVVLGDIVLIFGIAGALLFLQPRLGIAVLSVIPILIATTYLFQNNLREAYRSVRLRIARVNAALSEGISGIRLVQIFNGEKEQELKFEALNRDHRDAQISSVFCHAMLAPAVTLVNALAIIIILLLGGSMVTERQISLGTLISFLAYVQYFFFPIRDLTEKISFFQSAMAAAERVFGLMDEPEESPLHEGASLPDLHGEIRFDKVRFAYQEDKPVLRDLSFHIRPGQSIALVGQTGAGKTTIASLLNRFYEIQGGTICIDGHDIKTLAKSFLRKNIVIIQQDVFIFSGDITENIRLWNPDISPEKVREAAIEANAAKFIDRLPQGFATELAERGGNLSTGQRQLLAFSRVLANQPRILVLDEATSSVDSETEKAIQDAIARITSGRTSLIIAHRLSTIRQCDRILVLHHGALVEEGTHEELLSRRGYYWKLYELQFKNGNGAEHFSPVGDKPESRLSS